MKRKSAILTRLSHYWSILKESAQRWSQDKVFRMGAALSYYTVFSIGPLLILVIGVGGLVLGPEAIHGELSKQFRGFLGDAGAEALESVIANTYRKDVGVIATITGAVALILGATGAFAELESSLNSIWKAEAPKISGILQFLKVRLMSFGMVVVIGFLLLVSLVVNTLLAGAFEYFARYLPISKEVFDVIYSVMSLGMVTVMFALVYKVLPSTKIRWSDVWMGSFLTATLFTVGRILISLYIGKNSTVSSFGASGAIVLIMLWAYYSSLIVFFGAEFINVVSKRHDKKIVENKKIHHSKTHKKAAA